MSGNFLETGTVNHNFETYSYENVLAELESETEENAKKITHFSQMLEDADDDDKQLLKEQYEHSLKEKEVLSASLSLLKEYPDEFPALYAMIAREDADQSGVQFTLNEVLAQTDEIVTEFQDVMPKGKQLELTCNLPEAGTFGIVVTPYDKAGEDSEQLKARINFPQKTIDDLNEAKLKAILEFCEKKGLSVYDLTIPYKDGIIDVDEKLAELTKQYMESRRLDDVEPRRENSDENSDENIGERIMFMEPEVDDFELGEFGLPKKKKKNTQKVLDINFIRKETIDFLEKDLKKTRGLSYFEGSKNINGVKMQVFTLYDKPNRENEKFDGRKDKNGNYVPTYAHKLYIGYDTNKEKFAFAYSMPGGKKMDDTMAGDFMGVIKKTGITHLRFHNLPNCDKGVWLVACGEKGIVPIGISLNSAKAKTMVEAARKKLSTEEFVLFKYRLADQMLENAQEKCKDKTDPRLGLDKSEYDFICGLKYARNFENFRIGYEDGLYGRVLDQIDKGSKDSEKGAAVTFGSMRALKTVFDIYFGHQEESFAQRLEAFKDRITPEELEALKVIPSSKKLGEFNTQDFVLLYDTILQHHIDNAEQDILHAYARELKRKPQRADGIVLSSDLFPRAKGAVNEINITLARNGIDTLTLPLEHKGLEFARPEVPNSNTQTNTQTGTQNNNQTNTQTNIVPPVNQNIR